MEFFAEMPHLLGLQLKGNPGMRLMKNPRRELLLVLENLAYLDDKPVLEPERLQVEAFKRGGDEEM